MTGIKRPRTQRDFTAVLRASNSDESMLNYLSTLPFLAGQEDGTATMTDLIYEIMIMPYVKFYWNTIPSAPGIGGRLKKVNDVYHRAETEFEAMTGRTRRVPRTIDLEVFMQTYFGDGEDRSMATLFELDV